MSKNTQGKTTQLGVRIPSELHKILENERLEALRQGEKVTMTDLVTKYLYAGLGRSPVEVREVNLTPTLERLTDVLDRLERKI